MDKIDHYSWLVQSKAKIVREMLAIHQILDLHSDAISNDESDRSIIGLAVGASFSLWRAAFLTDATRDWPQILRNAKAMLQQVIEDNAVTYPHDKATREWTVGFYLNNARYRLNRISEKIRDSERYSGVLLRPAFIEYQATAKSGGIDETSAHDAWSASYEFLHDIVATINIEYPTSQEISS